MAAAAKCINIKLHLYVVSLCHVVVFLSVLFLSLWFLRFVFLGRTARKTLQVKGGGELEAGDDSCY